VLLEGVRLESSDGVPFFDEELHSPRIDLINVLFVYRGSSEISEIPRPSIPSSVLPYEIS
jgi:hypothetical protein